MLAADGRRWALGRHRIRMMTLFDWIVRFLTWAFRRPCLSIRITDDNPEQKVGGLKFEAENTSPTRSSLHPVVEA